MWLSRERAAWLAGCALLCLVMYWSRGQCDDGTNYAPRKIDCPSPDAKGLQISLPHVIRCAGLPRAVRWSLTRPRASTIELWHITLHKIDDSYTPGLWGLTSPSVYKWKKVGFIYEQVDLLMKKGGRGRDSFLFGV